MSSLIPEALQMQTHHQQLIELAEDYAAVVAQLGDHRLGSGRRSCGQARTPTAWLGRREIGAANHTALPRQRRIIQGSTRQVENVLG